MKKRKKGEEQEKKKNNNFCLYVKEEVLLSFPPPPPAPLPLSLSLSLSLSLVARHLLTVSDDCNVSPWDFDIRWCLQIAHVISKQLTSLSLCTHPLHRQ